MNCYLANAFADVQEMGFALMLRKEQMQSLPGAAGLQE